MTTFFTYRKDQNFGTCCDDCTGNPCECEQEPCFYSSACPRPDNPVIDCDTGREFPHSLDIPCCPPTKPNTMVIETWALISSVFATYSKQQLYDSVSNWNRRATRPSDTATGHYYLWKKTTYSDFTERKVLVDPTATPYAWKPCMSSYCIEYRHPRPEFDYQGTKIAEDSPRGDYRLNNCNQDWMNATESVIEYRYDGSIIDTTTSSYASEPIGWFGANVYRRSGGILAEYESPTSTADRVYANPCDCGDTYVTGIGGSTGGVEYNRSFFGSGGVTAQVVSVT